MAQETTSVELGDDDYACAGDYPEHDPVETYRGDDGVAWDCRRCGAEGWEPVDGEEN